MYRFRTELSLNIFSHVSPKANLARETLKLIIVSRWNTQNLLPWPKQKTNSNFAVNFAEVLKEATIHF